MINYKEALRLISILTSESPLETEMVDLEQADGRFCSQDIFSPEDVPSFNNSAMDGFAVRSQDTNSASEENPIELLVNSVIAAGDDVFNSNSVKLDSTCVEIMTGAQVPSSFDSVVKIEDVIAYRDLSAIVKKITLSTPVLLGQNIRLKGHDYHTGQLVLRRGSQIRAESLMALASLGITQIHVFKKPTVAILATGKELVSPQTKSLTSGMIRNSTSVYLKTALGHLGAQVVDAQLMGDSIDYFKNYVQKIFDQKINILVTTGAVSMGVFDFVVPTLLEMGAKIVFHKVAIRPGKPILLATMTNSVGHQLIIFGMPGNPVSSAVGLRFFLAPYLRQLNARELEPSIPMKLTKTINKPQGLQCFYKARIERVGNKLEANASLGQGSFMISSLVQANAWVVFSEEGNKVSNEDDVFVYPLLPDQSFDLEVL